MFRIAVPALAVFLVTSVQVAPAIADDPSVDPCTLISRADVEQIVGKLKTDPKPSRNDRARVCEYELANGKDFLNLWLYPAAGLERARQELKQVAPVPDVGGDAFLFHNTRLEEVELFAKKGNVTIEVTLTGSPGAEEKVKALARKALGRL